MKRFSKWMLGFWPMVVGATVLATTPATVLARETNSAPQIKVDDTPIERETHGVTSFAPIIKRVAPSVVNIYSSRTVRERESNPFFNDPLSTISLAQMTATIRGRGTETAVAAVPGPAGRKALGPV